MSALRMFAGLVANRAATALIAGPATLQEMTFGDRCLATPPPPPIPLRLPLVNAREEGNV